jgi:hypothetical protein
MEGSYARNVVYAKRMRAVNPDDDEGVDPEMWETARGGGAKREQRERARAVSAAGRKATALEKCWFCVSNERADKELIVSLAGRCYLALPAHGRLVPGHCLLVPGEHLSAMTEADDDVVQEIRVRSVRLCCPLYFLAPKWYFWIVGLVWLTLLFAVPFTRRISASVSFGCSGRRAASRCSWRRRLS